MKSHVVLKSFRYILAAAVLVSLVPAVMVVLSMQIVPDRYLLVALPIYVIVTILMLLLVVAKNLRRGWLVLGIVMALVLCTVNIKVYMMSRATGSFLESLEQPKISFVEFSIIAQKGSEVTLDGGGSAGLINRDELYEPAIEALSRETSAQTGGYESLTGVVGELLAGNIDMAVIRSANLELVKENAPESYASVVILGKLLVKDLQHESSAVDMARPFALYISGIDTYGQIDSTARSDVNMLMVVHPVDRKVLLINTPRDYYVQLHGTTGLPDKLTHAGVYGVHTSRQTLEDLYGVAIPHYVRLNFTSLVKLIDTIGEIEVQSDYDFMSFSRGPNMLDSKRALEFARERYSFEDGDRQRGRNQQLVIEGIIAKLSEPGNLTRYSAILKSLENTVQTDISQEAIRQFIYMQLDDMKHWQVESTEVDGFGDLKETYSMGGVPLYVMTPDQSTVDRAKMKIQEYLAE